MARARGAQDGHEGLRESALGEQAPQQVGNTESDPEGIGQAPAPNARAIRMSRINPVMRESSVKLLTVAAERNNAMGTLERKSVPATAGTRDCLAVYFGGIRIAPSRRIVSPLSMSLVMMLCTSLA